jgi:hypothetical protein
MQVRDWYTYFTANTLMQPIHIVRNQFSDGPVDVSAATYDFDDA